MSEESISLHPHVQAVVKGTAFIEAVRSYCILLQANSSLTDEAIRKIALTHSYPRIGLILATSKDKDGNPILGGFNAESDYSAQYKEVIRLIVSPPYRDDIHRISAQLTASQIIKQLPLESSLQFYKLGVHLEEQAVKDLERISNAAPKQDTSKEPAPLSLYIRGFIDRSRLVGSPICWYYLTTTTDTGELSSSQGAIALPDGDLDAVTSYLALQLNEAFIDIGANLVASPNALRVPSADSEGTSSLYKLTVASRTPSIRSTRELLVVRLLTVRNGFNPNDISSDTLQDFIPGLEYGVNQDNLSFKGPYSLLLEVKEGTTAAYGLYTKTRLLKDKDLRDLDTFYFRQVAPNTEGEMVYRIVSGDEVLTKPERRLIYTGDLTQLVLDFLQDLHASRWQNPILGSLPFSNSLRVVLANPSDRSQLKVVIDILSLPTGVELALGDILYRFTPYQSGPRSITVKAVTETTPLLPPGSGSQPSQQYVSATKTVHRQISPRIQAVYDKLDQIRRGCK